MPMEREATSALPTSTAGRARRAVCIHPESHFVTRHSRARGCPKVTRSLNPGQQFRHSPWTPAFAGVTMRNDPLRAEKCPRRPADGAAQPAGLWPMPGIGACGPLSMAPGASTSVETSMRPAFRRSASAESLCFLQGRAQPHEHDVKAARLQHGGVPGWTRWPPPGASS